MSDERWFVVVVTLALIGAVVAFAWALKRLFDQLDEEFSEDNYDFKILDGKEKSHGKSNRDP